MNLQSFLTSAVNSLTQVKAIYLQGLRAEASIDAALCFVLLTAYGIWLRNFLKRYEKEYDPEPEIVFLGVAGIVCVPIFIGFITSVLKVINPEYYLIKQVIQGLR
jgi:hypothetical protein